MVETWAQLFHQDNDPEHIRNQDRFLERIEEANINLLEWSSQSPNLNPVENLWNDLWVGARKPTNLNGLHHLLPRRAIKHSAEILPEASGWLAKVSGWGASC